jgi:toxin YoeB
MLSLSFLLEAWEDYMYWQEQDKKTLKKINHLLRDICRNGYEGIGKPEALSGNLSGWWSRRIDESNRIVYRVEQDTVIIFQCRSHYEQ